MVSSCSINYAKLTLGIVAFLLLGSGFITNAQPTNYTVANVKIHMVLDQNFPDPTVIRVGNKYYAYATQGSVNGKRINVQVASSTDHEHWKYEGEALPVKPAWVSKRSAFWAPDVFFDPNLHQFVLFISVDPVEKPGKCIGVAFSNNPLGPFTLSGAPIICGRGDIDPKGFTDPKTKKHFLYWGSGFKPLKVQEMTEDWSAVKPGSVPVSVVWPNKDSTYSHLLEGSWLDYNKGTYYLYYSGDNCCGNNPNYAVMVAKANNPTGPFKRLGKSNNTFNSVVLQKDAIYTAPGHNSIFTDEKGNKFIAYHAFERTHKEKGRVMCINPIKYKNGWPMVLNK